MRKISKFYKVLNTCAFWLPLLFPCLLHAQSTERTLEKLPYADFENWLSRLIKESAVVGGEEKTVYAIADNGTVRGKIPYINTKSPWASSNVYAEVFGVDKVNVNVFPGDHAGGKCAVLRTEMMSFRLIGMVRMNVITAGAIFLGRMFEPIKDMDAAYGSVDMGIKFNKRPKALVLDYAAKIGNSGTIIFASGKKKETYAGYDKAVVLVQLQKRWEENGEIYAQRVATGELLIDKTCSWVEGYRLPLEYGKPADISSLSAFAQLQDFFHAVNSKGKRVPIKEVGWASPDATPTHLVIFISSGTQGTYKGELGNELRVDNIMLEY